MSADATAAYVLDRCSELGFALAGIAPAAPTSYAKELRDWLDAGRHGEMEYLARNVELRIDPAAMVPGARSIICVADRYHKGGRDLIQERSPDDPRGPIGRIARYARGDDYHVVMRERLETLRDDLRLRFPEHAFRACVDTAPVLEREHAWRAGLGSVGKHTLLIQSGIGSYLLLGEIITTLALEPSKPADPDPCSTCTRCIDACPTDAITPWSVDASRCVSYLTIEHRGRIDPSFHEPIGDWLFGCDICQEVCPHNQPTRRSRKQEVHAAYSPRRSGFDALEALGWTESARQAAFVNSSMKRARLDMMKRNAAIVAGNALAKATGADPAKLRERLEQAAADPHESELVRQAARDALSRADGTAGAAAVRPCGPPAPPGRT